MRTRNKIDYRLFVVANILILVLILAVVLGISQNKNLVDINNDISLDNSDEEIDWNRYQTYEVGLSDSLTITKSGTYYLTGSISDGLIKVDAGVDDVRLLLDNVSIHNSSGPAIACFSANNLVIELVGDNYLSDGTVFDSSYDEDVNGVIYSKEDLIFQGNGSLSLAANYQDGIVGKDDVKFKGGHYKIEAVDDGIRGKDSVYVVNGDFSINVKGDAITSTNSIDRDKGFILISGGVFEISAGDDGIRANHELCIDGGTINILSSYEGLEAQVIAINGGNISISSNDDGVNAGNKASNDNTDSSCVLSINGGEVYINAGGDGVDSNGYIYFNGGSTIIDGPTNDGNGSLDSGLGITMNGGVVIAVGSSGMAETLGNSSSVNNLSMFFSQQLGANTKIEIKNADNITILSHISAKKFNYLAAGSTDFTLGETYAVYINEEKFQDFIISGVTTTVGSGNNIFNRGFRR